ncbi:MAG: AAA family ATPase [Thiobacillus sp.]|nr:AAA family ATPase [Thiobacillus sp.]
MKITAIQTGNFLGARAVDVKLTKPVALFAGKNGAGKSSVQEAVRMALTGESVRVGLKKDFAALVTEGQESGFVEVGTEVGAYSVVLPAGKGIHSDSDALPYVLDAQRFARLDPNERRAFLFGLMGLKTDGKAVKERLTATVAPEGAKWTPRGCDAVKVEAIAPFLRAGFDAAQKEAQGKARECKASWKTTTGGEAYGSVKAASWAAAKPEVDTAGLDQARADLAAVDNEIETETKRLGELQGRAKQRAEQQGKLNGLRQQAGMYARFADKLARDEAGLKELEEKVEATRAKASGQIKAPLTCPHCAGLVVHVADHESTEFAASKLEPYTPGGQADPEAAAALPEYERALKLMQSAVANCKRDLAAADTAARTLKELEDETGEPDDGADHIGALEQRIAAIKHHRGNHQAAIRLIEEAERRAAEADEKTTRAAALHQDVQAWEAIAAALAPDGIPGEMLAEALGPINARLEQSAADAEWPRMMIDTDMSILKRHKDRMPRPYALLSESEKWRADAMIAEAIAHLSDVRLLVLDRFDVLDLKGREDLLVWLDILAQDSEIDTALIFGTLKGLPAQLPETVEAFWLDNGVAGQMKEAA